ncbi:hypothetical protein EVAR_53719_1 [Eumeta japonica]|uniref:DUF5641 domain-containing protein n=1 Tax=Eumeta variegata TaxID=151549 RepID=A0A4C1Z3X4_EUMVA|nr:hypothetical protein EVAR_53719_1 [Eumeta japonica]
MGGAWERLVQSIKRALAVTLHERYPRKEVFATLLLEAEYMVNSRPLTHVSVSAGDPEALTPNHFLFWSPGHVSVPGSFSDSDTYGRQQWRHTQRLADRFWTRWVREYLPTLQHRREPVGRGHPLAVGDIVIMVDETLTGTPGCMTSTPLPDARSLSHLSHRPSARCRRHIAEARPAFSLSAAVDKRKLRTMMWEVQ